MSLSLLVLLLQSLQSCILAQTSALLKKKIGLKDLVSNKLT